MKTFNTIIIIVLISISTQAAKPLCKMDISGKWLGTLTINESLKLRLGFDIYENDSSQLTSVVHSLDQGAFDIPVKTTALKNDSVFIEIKALDSFFRGKIINNKLIEGSFLLGNSTLALKLARVSDFPIEKVKRPQEPERPYPYDETDINFKNVESKEVTLAGTLTTPKGEGPFPAVILISGSGPNDRDAQIFGHKYFLVLADYLTRSGIAVLRTDDRGTNESTGDYDAADILALSSDVVSAFDYLSKHSKIDARKIGIIGHSHGASIAPVAAVKEKNIAFAILMAGAAESLSENIIEQAEIIYKQLGVSDKGIALNTKYLNTAFDIVNLNTKFEEAKKQFEVFCRSFEKELKSLSEKELNILELRPPLSSNIIKEFMSPAMKKDLFFQPTDYLNKIHCPTLIINGSKDVQVPIRHLKLTENLIKSNGNVQVTAKAFKDKNHLFQTAQTGSVSEYQEIEETISPEVLSYLSEWILNNIK